MFSVIAADALAIADSPTLKSSPAHLPSRLHPADEYVASAWATNNSALYLASAHTISRYNPSSNQLQTLHTHDDGYIVRCIAVSDPTTVVFGAGAQVYILDCSTSSPEIVQTLGPFHHDILSFSLSNDSTLLACGVSNAVHIHNFSTGSQTTLRGLPSSLTSAICVFHSHIRTRLLVGSLDQLFIYETTRPSAPFKVISMSEAGGCISALACSPFSKTLVAVAMSSGIVGLVDMDKEKGLFRMVDLQVPLTTVEFSPEGASIYLGTEDGRLLIQDLRALDKPPKSIIVSELGNPIDTLAVQKKIKSLPNDAKGKGTPRTLAKKLANTSASKSTPSPLRSRTAQSSDTISSTPTRKVFSRSGTPKRVSLTKATNPKNVLLPTRDPHRNSTSADPNETITSAAAKPKKLNPLSSPSPKKSRSNSARIALATQATRRSMSSNPVRPRKSSLASTVGGAELSVVPQLDFSPISNIRPLERPRSKLSTVVSESAPTLPLRSSRTRSTSSESSQKQSSPPPSLPPVSTKAVSDLRSSVLRSSILKTAEGGRTPSPNLPSIETNPITPVPLQKKKKAMAVLGLGTPEVTERIKGKNRDANGTSRVRSVGFKDENELREETDDTSESTEDEEREREKSLSMQVTPRRLSASQAQNHGPKPAWSASPLFRQSHHPAHVSGTPTGGNAHELLRSIMKDVMYEFQMENKAELMGLHLDLVKMGRGWKQELKTLMEEYVGDLNDLREENKRLREENVKLRRGY